MLWLLAHDFLICSSFYDVMSSAFVLSDLRTLRYNSVSGRTHNGRVTTRNNYMALLMSLISVLYYISSTLHVFVSVGFRRLRFCPENMWSQLVIASSRPLSSSYKIYVVNIRKYLFLSLYGNVLLFFLFVLYCISSGLFSRDLPACACLANKDQIESIITQ